jgi:hypothetical protein
VPFGRRGRHILAFGALLGVVVYAAWAYSRGPIGCGAMESGGTLYLNRLGVETPRASFCYAPDCRLVAEQMTKAEKANWYCR